MGEELWEPRTLAGSISRGILPVPPCKKRRCARRASVPLPAAGSLPFCSHNTRGRESDCVLEPPSQLCQAGQLRTFHMRPALACGGPLTESSGCAPSSAALRPD